MNKVGIPLMTLLSALVALSTALGSAKKKETTQVLELPKDPPLAIAVETRNLVFQSAPLSNKGLLTQQTKDAIKALLKSNNGATIVKIRAFVAGAGDMRRVPAIISEALTEKKLPLPVITVVQAGSLGLEGAQVALESIAAAKREVTPTGLVFTSGQNSLSALNDALGNSAAGVLRVTCFTTSPDDAVKLQAAVSSKYPGAALSVIVVQRATARRVVDCDATAKLISPGGFDPTKSVAVTAEKVALSGTQMAFGSSDKDARLAFERLNKSLETVGATAKSVAMVNFYPLSNSIAEQVRRVSAEFLNGGHAETMELFEGLPAMEASFAMDVTATIQ